MPVAETETEEVFRSAAWPAVGLLRSLSTGEVPWGGHRNLWLGRGWRCRHKESTRWSGDHWLKWNNRQSRTRHRWPRLRLCRELSNLL